MPLAFLFGTGAAALTAAEAHVAALNRCTPVLAEGPELTRCECAAGNVSLPAGKECTCTDPATPLPGCPYTTTSVERPWQLRLAPYDGEIVVLVSSYHTDEIVDGVNLDPALAVDVPLVHFRPADENDSTTGPIP